MVYVENNTGKDVEVPKKVTSMPRPPPPFTQRLVKKTEDDKYRLFITMLKQLSINGDTLPVILMKW